MTSLATQLLDLAERDEELRARLVQEGKLFAGYNREMEALHVSNGKALEELMERFGWPSGEKDGRAAVQAAWLIAMHAISLPALQKKILEVLIRQGDELSAHTAMLEDRVRVFSGKKQKFGTQFDWNSTGELVPYPIEDPERVDALRSHVGLPPLHEQAERLRANATREGESAPSDYAQHVQDRVNWMIQTGWIESQSEIDPSYFTL